ncbi:MAG: hypothetical protein JO255_12090 [Alphaproteobacteria bacterium]|nr:hypothetical protein [Alphaproteobacteria bacterium]
MIAGFLALVRRDLGEDLRALVGPPGPKQPRPAGGSHWILSAVLWIAAFALYFGLGLRLDSGAYFAVDNFAFDFDPQRFTDVLFTGAGSGNGIRHPFLSALHLVTHAALHLGLPLNVTISLVFAAVGAATVPVVYGLAAALAVPPLERVLFTVFFALSSTPLFLALVPESYGFSALGLAVLYLVVLKRQVVPERWLRARFVLALYLFGVTTTNIVQAGIAEMVIWLRALAFLPAVARLASYGILLGILLALGVAAVIDWPALIHDPVGSVKAAYWASAEHGQEKASFAMLLKTFFGYSFIAPEFTAVPLPNGEATMLDFRDFRMTTGGLVAFALWLIVLAVGILAGLRDRENRTLFLSLAIAILVNLLLHTTVQYRASVYIYAAHLHIPIFVMALLAGRHGGARGGIRRFGVVAALIALVLLAGYNNLARALELVTSFG